MKILEILQQVNQAKDLKRSGWVRENIPDPESVAEHIFGTAFLALVLGPKLGVDETKLVKMAIIHDVAETKIGDVVWDRGKIKLHEVKNQKDRDELEAIKDIFAEESDEYIELFVEMQKLETAEAKIFKQLDRLEMAVQALHYEHKFQKDLTEFFDSVDSYLTHPVLVEIHNQIKTNRPQI